MKYLQEKFTVDMGRVNPEMCCERCVFNRGGFHADFCSLGFGAEINAALQKAFQETVEEWIKQHPVVTKDQMLASEGL